MASGGVYFSCYFFIFGCTGSLALVAASGGCSSCGTWASHCSGFSACEAQALGRTGFSCDLWALQHRVSSCGAWAELPHGKWNLPGPGTDPWVRKIP